MATRPGGAIYQYDRVRPFSNVDPRLAVGVDVVFCDEALSREAQEHTRGTALTHLVPQHHYLQRVRGEEREIKCHWTAIQVTINIYIKKTTILTVEFWMQRTA